VALFGSRVFGLIGPLFPLFPINGGSKRGREQVIIGPATPITRRYQTNDAGSLETTNADAG